MSETHDAHDHNDADHNHDDHVHVDGHDHSDGTHDHTETFDADVFDPALYGSADHLAGTTGPNGKPIWSAQQAADYLFRAGAGYGTGGNMIMPTGGDVEVLAYGFHTGQQSLYANGYVYVSPTTGRLTGLSEYFNFRPFTDAQKTAAREAMQYWDDVVSTTFVETHINDADIAFGNYVGQGQAYARLLSSNVSSNPAINRQILDIGGDIWVNANAASNFHLDEGGYGMNTLSHEIGHGFGMLHPGDYNAVAGGPPLSYTQHAEYYQDTRSYSILSYWNPREIGAMDYDWTRMTLAYGATPMVHDILSMQRKYGAEMTTRTGDTVYGFNSNAGRDAFDFVKTPAPTMTIWDAGGIDTLDASGYAVNQVIDLNPGALSSIGGITLDQAPTFAEVNASRAAAGIAPVSQALYDSNMAFFRANPSVGRLTDNVGIAYGAIIENAVGGTGHDALLGNNADNRLEGRGGNDLLAASLGNDTLDGGTGNDTMLGGKGDDLYIVGEEGDTVTELENEGTDTVRSSISYTLGAHVENLTLVGADAPVGAFAAAAVSVITGTGNDLANVINATGSGAFKLDGGAGSDTIEGGDSDDILVGGDGDDSLTGGRGNDEFVGGQGADRFTGGDGDDFYIVDDLGDVVVEEANGGRDTVKVNLDGYILAAGVEGVQLGTGAVNASGNELDNALFGNDAGNRLSGGGGNDVLNGGKGRDFLAGGEGIDTFVFSDADANAAGKTGAISLDVITDYQAGEDIDLSAFDFAFVGNSSGKGAGELAMRTFGNVNAAEAALGFDIDGIDGASPYGGPVTVLLGNIDGGAPDIAIVLLNTKGVGSQDLLL